MMHIKRIAVFCGASVGANPNFAEAARQLGAALSAANIGLVYGGGKVGLMGEIADSMLQQGGEVIGVIPQFLANKELAHAGVTKMHTVNSMHERKALIADLADGFIALPGGIGTLDELIEMYTWTQLGIHDKPCGILNVDNYYDDFLQFLGHMIEMKFLRASLRDLLLVENNAIKLVNSLMSFQRTIAPRWTENKAEA